MTAKSHPADLNHPDLIASCHIHYLCCYMSAAAEGQSFNVNSVHICAFHGAAELQGLAQPVPPCICFIMTCHWNLTRQGSIIDEAVTMSIKQPQAAARATAQGTAVPGNDTCDGQLTRHVPGRCAAAPSDSCTASDTCWSYVMQKLTVIIVQSQPGTGHESPGVTMWGYCKIKTMQSCRPTTACTS